MRACVTGGAGFIGANLVERLLRDGHEVLVLDDLSTGDLRFLASDIRERIELFEEDLSSVDVTFLTKILKGTDTLFHLAANADVRGGWNSTFRDIQHNVIATHNVALACREAGVKHIVFSSTGCVYGDSTVIPTPETEPFPIQTSLYGTSKVAAEGILSSFSAHGVFNVTVLRFVSVLGRYYHHGHVIDFVRQLMAHPRKLNILGDGNQRKSYISVKDCVEALVSLRGENHFEVFNIGNPDYCEVKASASLISQAMNLSPEFSFGTESRGWVGDNPYTFLDVQKAFAHGWKSTISIQDCILETVNWIRENPWVLSLDSDRHRG
jgi:UDP-glucose 4-epimerase